MYDALGLTIAIIFSFPRKHLKLYRLIAAATGVGSEVLCSICIKYIDIGAHADTHNNVLVNAYTSYTAIIPPLIKC